MFCLEVRGGDLVQVLKDEQEIVRDIRNLKRTFKGKGFREGGREVIWGYMYTYS